MTNEKNKLSIPLVVSLVFNVVLLSLLITGVTIVERIDDRETTLTTTINGTKVVPQSDSVDQAQVSLTSTEEVDIQMGKLPAMQWPAASSSVSQWFVMDRHLGVDFTANTNTPVIAVWSGVVKEATCGWNNGYGCYVLITHNEANQLETLYASLAEPLVVKVGQTVNVGDMIGTMGNAHNVAGPYLHFEVRVNGIQKNPQTFWGLPESMEFSTTK